MPPAPRLTIGIPTYDRPALLARAVASALAQQRPARVLIADQTGRAAEAVRPWLSNPLVRYIKTPATNLWENWTFAAECCDTEFFAWLQDDDLVAPHFSLRVESAFDAFPKAAVYLARLGISTLDGVANWWQCCGPMVPMDLLHGLPSAVNGLLITAGGYFSSFALSPGMAFRWSLDAIEAIRRCPHDGCDLYNERIVIAELAARGDVVCDPAIVGYWVQHEGNESKVQVRTGGRTAQYPILVERLDALLASHPGWERALEGWCYMVGPGVLDHWLSEARDYESASPTYARALAIVRETAARYRPIAPEAQPEVPRQRPVSTATNGKARRAERAVRRS